MYEDEMSRSISIPLSPDFLIIIIIIIIIIVVVVVITFTLLSNQQVFFSSVKDSLKKLSYHAIINF